MIENRNHLPESLRIKYCFKGDKTYHLYHCLLIDLNYEKLISLIKEDINSSYKIGFLSSQTKEEKIVSSKKEFDDFLNSSSFITFLDSKYICLKVHFYKELKSKIRSTKLNSYIMNNKISSVSLDYMFDKFILNDIAKKELFNLLKEKNLLPKDIQKEISDDILTSLLQIIKDNYDIFINSKSSLGKLDLEINLQNLDENSSTDKCQDLNFSKFYDINELNSVTNMDIIRNSSIFRTSSFKNGQH